MPAPSNGTLLFIAFLTFFLFAVLQTVFAVIGNSESMLGEGRDSKERSAELRKIDVWICI